MSALIESFKKSIVGCVMYKLLFKLHIIETCPNCDSAWTGGDPNPENLTSCVVCGNKEGKITGWVWGRLIDPFCWMGNRTVRKNLYKEYGENWKI